jgi:hypothetical protein
MKIRREQQTIRGLLALLISIFLFNAIPTFNAFYEAHFTYPVSTLDFLLSGVFIYVLVFSFMSAAAFIHLCPPQPLFTYGARCSIARFRLTINHFYTGVHP